MEGDVPGRQNDHPTSMPTSVDPMADGGDVNIAAAGTAISHASAGALGDA